MALHRILQVAALALAFAGACVIIYTSREKTEGPEPLPVVAPKAAGKSAPVPLKGDAVKAPVKKKAPEKVDKNRLLQLPDGSTVPVLNHAYGAPKMSWPKDRPWSPITGKYTDANTGEEWYMHEDGSRSSTLMRWHTHLNANAPMTNVLNPTKPVAMDPDEIASVRRKQEEEAKKKAAQKK